MLSQAPARSEYPNSHDFERKATSGVPKRSFSLLKSNMKDGYGVEKPGTSAEADRRPNVLVRKKLPWLDRGQQGASGKIPGQFDSKESLVFSDANATPLPVPEKDNVPTTKTAPATALGHDPALRAVGSTPSLRKRARSGDFKTFSVSSKPRAGVKPATSKAHARRSLGMVDEGPQPSYASSESSATPSSEKGEVPTRLRKNDASSYERLVDRRASVKGGTQEPHQVPSQWLQSQIDLPLDPPSPRTMKRSPTVPITPGTIVRSPELHYAADSGRNIGTVAGPRQLPKAKTLPRRFEATPYVEPPSAFPPAPPVRQPTLFAMPTHLMASSSSSPSPPPRMLAQQTVVSQPAQQAPRSRSLPAVRSPHTKRQSQDLNRAVTGLENLMEEALNVARMAAERGEDNEAANILHSATMALRKASTVHLHGDIGRMSKPLRLSPPESPHDVIDSDSDGSDSDRYSTASTSHSDETAPTLLTKSAHSSQQPIVVDQYKSGNRAPKSHKASVEQVADYERGVSPDRGSMSQTPPRLYQPPSADSIVRDFAYAREKTARAQAARQLSRARGAAFDYYGDQGPSVETRPGVRKSLSAPIIVDKPLPPLPGATRSADELVLPNGRRQQIPVRLRVEHMPTDSIPPRKSSRSWEKLPDTDAVPRQRRPKHQRHHLSDVFESPYYSRHRGQDRGMPDPSRDVPVGSPTAELSDPTTTLRRDISLKHPRRKHISLREGQGFSLGRSHRRQPIAREWNTHRKRIAATIACMNTVFVGLITGIYAGEVPAIQYRIADTHHRVIQGNVV
ncbi:hypothetical protein LTR37_015377 [Vermiconidia calcicola]|uniref:Uncharacterized protein n=1 Tax=Vermiconidia calcicola TaxID=1690605 RepID=A0ACC3MR03_9PEZI|nr:hypothetical protein LTR37_015377 [Vermiconidia calcicola]